MKDALAKTIYLKDYQTSPYLADTIDLTFSLDEEFTLVTSKVKYRRNIESSLPNELELFGRSLELVGIRIDDVEVDQKQYTLTDEGMTITDLPFQFVLEIDTRIYPQKNTSLEGLYQSSGNFCTQCEAQGFRKITYYLDRPDIMATFSTKIIGNKEKYPILLSNGNLEDSGNLEDGRHWAKWHDPHKKPAYLFALVAGNLEYVEDKFTTQSGRDVDLKIYTEAHNIDKCDHAMESLKCAMKWDEERFGLEYDLDIYMIVAVDDFNMGAMENKGLNIFNSKLVFASPETATDDNYISIEAVIGHEYFHNWTGNRVTCRDWFQLSLKEGLTVFRDQEFTSDLHSRSVKRIEDVRMLRSHQFSEDASPMAHPIRPASFAEINNFYTLTVYEKGAEVVRLYHTLLGKDGFRKGMDLYFERHDGQAVTTEDFLASMADANGKDLSQFENWYNQAGTPVVRVAMDYDADKQSCTLNFKQSCPPTPESDSKKPFIIPVKLGLLDSQGKDYDLALEDDLIVLTEEEQSFQFDNIAEKPVPSLMRGFSAPVKLEYDYSADDYIFLMQYDSDEFNRWNASQQLAMKLMLDMLSKHQREEAYGLAPTIIDAYQQILNNDELDPALRAEVLTLPSQTEIAEASQPANPQAIFEVRENMLKTLANSLRIDLEAIYNKLAVKSDYQVDHQSIGQRALKNTCLDYLTYIDDTSIAEMAYEQFKSANNMTDQIAAFNCLTNISCPEHDQAVAEFEAQWKGDALVMDKWFFSQATSKLPDTLENIKSLLEHNLFDIRNPNKVRSLINAFAAANPVNFHNDNGEGYAFIADRVIQLDEINPQVASRLVRTLMNWKHYEAGRAEKMREQLQRISAKENLSKDVSEIVMKSLS